MRIFFENGRVGRVPPKPGEGGFHPDRLRSISSQATPISASEAEGGAGGLRDTWLTASLCLAGNPPYSCSDSALACQSPFPDAGGNNCEWNIMKNKAVWKTLRKPTASGSLSPM